MGKRFRFIAPDVKKDARSELVGFTNSVFCCGYVVVVDVHAPHSVVALYGTQAQNVSRCPRDFREPASRTEHIELQLEETQISPHSPLAMLNVAKHLIASCSFRDRI